jgi:hypothetical protein
MILLTNIVIAVATAVYAWINYKQLKESQVTRKQKTTPLIIAFLKTTDNHSALSLHIKNIGEGVAKNVHITIIRDYFILGNKMYPVSSLNIVKNGVSIFPPQYEFVNVINAVHRLSVNSEDNHIELKINYESVDGEQYNEFFDLPFNQYTGCVFYCNPPGNYVGDIAYYMKEINTAMKKYIEIVESNKNNEVKSVLYASDIYEK